MKKGQRRKRRDRLSCILTGVFLLIMLTPLTGQKEDYNWRFGYKGQHDPEDSWWGRSVVDFRKYYDKEDFVYYDRNSVINYWHTCAIMSDGEGEYLFSYNGRYIEDASLQVMENGNGMSESGSQWGESMSQGGIILPWPEREKKYVLLHMNVHYFDTIVSLAGQHLHYSVIDMAENGGLGAVVEKRVLLLSDTLNHGKLTATRHANGRDWWILVPHYNSDKIWRILLDDKGPRILDRQSTGLVHTKGFGEAGFSRDGSKYAFIVNLNAELGNYLYVYDFDRCSGELSNPKVHHFALGSLIICGFSFSPGGEILYLLANSELYQFDLTAEDIWSTKTLIAQTNDLVDVSPGGFTYRPRFSHGQLGPDGKIYIAGPNGRFINTIDYPDEWGESCGVRQGAIVLPTLNDGTMPYFPNFRLGPLEGSSCDTLGIVNMPLSRWRADQSEEDYLDFRLVDNSDYAPVAWQWDFGDGRVSDERHPVHRFSAPGTYEICLTVSNAHGSDTSCAVFRVGPVSVGEEKAAERYVSVYPNPMGNDLYIDVKDYYPQAAKVILYDLEGRAVKEQRLYHGSNYMYVGGLPAGMYVYKVEDGGIEMSTGKVVKH